MESVRALNRLAHGETLDRSEAAPKRGVWVLECKERPGQTYTPAEVAAEFGLKESSVKSLASPSSKAMIGGMIWRRVGLPWPQASASAVTGRPRKHRLPAGLFPGKVAPPPTPAASVTAGSLHVNRVHLAKILLALSRGQGGVMCETDIGMVMNWYQGIAEIHARLQRVLDGEAELKIEGGEVRLVPVN